ncbi:MAG: hypothetical protein F6J93_23635 [Oscillatoria sp. SIO1A7]|nr:hypothetical protein [Oscillatoria sp. SIO1A7]
MGCGVWGVGKRNKYPYTLHPTPHTLNKGILVPLSPIRNANMPNAQCPRIFNPATRQCHLVSP